MTVKEIRRWRAIERKLKPCPLCGSRVYYRDVTWSSNIMWREINCNCGLRISDKIRKRLIEKWNRRAANAEQQ